MKFIIIIIITAIIFGLINFYGCSKEYIYIIESYVGLHFIQKIKIKKNYSG